MPQSPTVELPKRWPLVVAPSNRDGTTSKDARLVNGYIEKGTDGNYEVYKRPGMAVSYVDSNSYAAGTARGFFSSANLGLLAIIDNHFYVNGSLVGNLSSSPPGYYFFTEYLGATPGIAFTNGPWGYYYDGALHTMGGTEPPSGGSTRGTPGLGYLDGTIYYVARNSRVYGSGLNDPNTWDALNFLLADTTPDGGKMLIRHLSYVIAFKSWSAEVFYDAGNATASPLAPVQGAHINWGCANTLTMLDIDGNLYWIGTTRSGAASILCMSNLQVSVISDARIDRLLSSDMASVFGTAASWSYKNAGHVFYIVTIVGLNLTLAYDINEGAWSQWTDVDGNYLPIQYSQSIAGLQYLLHMTSGVVYQMDPSFTTDAGSVITFDLYTPNFDGEVDRLKMLNMLRINADQQSGSVLQVRCNDSDYDPSQWTSYRNVDLSTKRPFLFGCGSFRRRAYHLRHQSSTPLRITSLDLQLDLGTL